MRYLSNSPYINVDGEIWAVNVGSKRQYKICPKHMKRIIRQLNIMCERYRRVFCVVFDLHMDVYTNDNLVISQFEKKLFPLIKSRYKVLDIGFAWVREMEKAKHQHYHMALMLDGKRIRHSSKILELIEQKWMLSGGGHAHIIENCYYNICNSEFSVKQDLIYRLSYQAKERGKGYRDIQTKDYGVSRLKPKS